MEVNLEIEFILPSCNAKKREGSTLERKCIGKEVQFFLRLLSFSIQSTVTIGGAKIPFSNIKPSSRLINDDWPKFLAMNTKFKDSWENRANRAFPS